MTEHTRRLFRLTVLPAFAVILTTTIVSADPAGVIVSDGDRFAAQTGESLYGSVCAACHMDQGQGAVGAGHYPALADNENLEARGYLVYAMVHGLKNMPAVGEMMSDEQVAAVANYVRTSFGNDYEDKVTAEEVAGAR